LHLITVFHLKWVTIDTNTSFHTGDIDQKMLTLNSDQFESIFV